MTPSVALVEAAGVVVPDADAVVDSPPDSLAAAEVVVADWPAPASVVGWLSTAEVAEVADGAGTPASVVG